PIVKVVAEALRRYRPSALVVDPVMVSTSGSRLIDENAIDAVVSEMFPLAALVTPNKSEAAVLSGSSDVAVQARRLHELGAAAVLLKGGDDSSDDVKTDWLSVGGRELIRIEAPAVDTCNTHGTGCTLSSAIACGMAMGLDVVQAVRLAKRYITQALEAGAHVSVGKGHGPVNHFFEHSKLKIYDHKD
ncbi:MAG: bifunctional hydroxymethylpyrimidine kinase/phosphomethylpyrimidine kinase, partial [Muribaculaceae bacterium]|nr:bifunctional hydroxymethylpyrimidine kinase/phosphomethylpyrimidine kinase [Muribaculaceae bacterium]